ncbi:MAG: zinc-binding alcohol dehydrogenase [Ruminococcaceae bacterium]|nr:zinc-binding alcohol dehydrogenase [Oscillospiraceae bacterium]
MSKNYKVVFTAQKKVELQECEMPVVGDDDILLKTEVSQISTGTELTLLEGNVEPDSPWMNDIHYPQDPGYSNVGKIVKVGKNVSSDLIGKRMLTLATHTMYYTINKDDYQQTMFIPDSVKSEEAVFGIIAQITMGSVRFSGLRPGDACVVYGAGLIGQLVARLAKCAGSTRVFVCDISDLRLDKLPDDPCFVKINTLKENAAEIVKNNTKFNEGAAVVFETTSNPKLVSDEIACLGKRGKLIITSSPKGKALVDLEYCNRMGISILGAHNSAVHTQNEVNGDPWTRRRDSEYFIELLEKNQTTASEMITHKCSFKDVVSMYEMLMEDRTQALAVNINWED